ncbi:LAGLIDADG family homing endonuclease [Streptomyces murinus]|uniref:LAGLIDADG family homing endonuclease n=1 Tax=Streptomyces murinus TaxID=33900 RepID=UPI000A1F0080|nr:LAGLIDADG family homing endonuclease [Streptomyces murinus]WDO06898.1 LAGLIDADG family homing endonuclease [Streptomyces murinus]
MAECVPDAAGFIDLEVPEYAYMFGFLQADGHLSRGTGQKGRLTVEVSARDVGLLRSFQKLTPYYSRITERTRPTNFAAMSTTAVWSLYSLEARTRVNGLGLPYGRKSGTIAPPSVEFSYRDYLRGLIDADGSVGHTNRGFPFVSLTTASGAIASCLCAYGKDVTGVGRTPGRNSRDGIHNVLYMMEAAQRLAADLYYPGCLSLERKHTAAGSLSAWVRPTGMRAAYTARRWSDPEDRALLELNSPKAAADVLGRTVKSCDIRLWRLRNGLVPMPGAG